MQPWRVGENEATTTATESEDGGGGAGAISISNIHTVRGVYCCAVYVRSNTKNQTHNKNLQHLKVKLGIGGLF